MRRVVIEGVPYHITQRGNHRQAVFYSDMDRVRFLKHAEKHLGRYNIRLLAYCLMTNHVHLVVVPETVRGISVALKELFRQHAAEMNVIRDTTGHLWEARFGSVPMDRPHLYQAIRYVELNPVRAALVKRAEDWQWSSARDHLGIGSDLCLLEDHEWRERFDASSWAEWLESPQDMLLNERLREATRTGRPVGSDEFIANLERRVGRRLTPAPCGRPRSDKSLCRVA